MKLCKNIDVLTFIRNKNTIARFCDLLFHKRLKKYNEGLEGIKKCVNFVDDCLKRFFEIIKII